MRSRKINRLISSVLVFGLAFTSGAFSFATTGAAAGIDPGQAAVVPAALDSIKVMEILTSPGAGYIGRNLVSSGAYPESMRGQVRPGSDTLTVDPIARPRELDDYHQAGIYETAGVPYEISELRLSEADAAAKYGADYPRYMALVKEISDGVYNGLNDGQGVFVVGTTCYSTVGAAAGLRRAFGDSAKLGLVYIDAHGDINTKYTTFSGSMGGMDVAPILGLDQEEWWQAACGGDMRTFDACVHACARDLDSGVDAASGQPFSEILNMQQAGANIVDVAHYNDEAYWREQIQDLAGKVDAIYLHVDADAVDRAFLPNVNTPFRDGPDIWTMMRNIRIVMDTKKVAVANLASIYFGKTFANGTQGFTFPSVSSLTGETVQQASNRASQISILTGIRLITSMFDSWKDRPVFEGSVFSPPKPPAPVPKAAGDLASLKVLEVLTSPGAGYIGRNLVSSGAYPESMRGQVVPGSDTLRVDSIARPRELDDYHQAGLYNTVKAPYEVSELRLSEADAAAKYGANYPRYQALAKEISDGVYSGLGKGSGVFVVGTSCYAAVGTAAGLRRAFGNGAKLGLVYIDAHGDINTKYTTFSGSMGGMDVAPILGLDQEEWWQAACGGNMRTFDACVHACARDLDSGTDAASGKPFSEILNMQQAGANIVDVAGYNDEANWRKQIQDLAGKVDAIYLHVDADAVDNAYLPNVNTPVKNGPDIWTMMRNIKIVMDTKKVAVTNLASIYFGRDYDKTRLANLQGFVFPDVNVGETAQQASNRASQISILTGIRLISTLLGNWKYDPVGKVLVSAAPSASVEKLNGNKNNLTVVVTETYLDGTSKDFKATFSIDNNAAGTYTVNGHKVYVDTKGNTQVRACYIAG